MRLQLVDKGSKKEPFWSIKKKTNERNDGERKNICVTKSEFKSEQQHHNHHYHQQKVKLIMEHNSRTTSTSFLALKRALLLRKLQRDRAKERKSSKLSGGDDVKGREEERDYVEEKGKGKQEYNLGDVCGFATTVSIDKQHQRCKSKRIRFKDKVGGCGFAKVDKRGSLCPFWPANNNGTLSTTHLSLSILIFIIFHLSISSCLQPSVFSEYKVPLLHQQSAFNGQLNDNNNMIRSKCK